MTNQRHFAIRRALLVLPLLSGGWLCGRAVEKIQIHLRRTQPAIALQPGQHLRIAHRPCERRRKADSLRGFRNSSDPRRKGKFSLLHQAWNHGDLDEQLKNTGFVVDVSDASPFDPGGAIIGGSSKDASVVAKTSGCYKYSVGACVSGALNGMCANASGELVVTNR